jgi:hypothetical protein
MGVGVLVVRLEEDLVGADDVPLWTADRRFQMPVELGHVGEAAGLRQAANLPARWKPGA